MLDLDEVLEELEESITGTKEPNERKKLKKYRLKLRKLQRIAQKKERTRGDVAKAMSITCYKNIGYCCGLEKDCIWRDCCRAALHIGDGIYVRVKEKVVWEMLARG
jgi:predicted metal-binding transcription factor (methanogenesis marker protein 9)